MTPGSKAKPKNLAATFNLATRIERVHRAPAGAAMTLGPVVSDDFRACPFRLSRPVVALSCVLGRVPAEGEQKRAVGVCGHIM